MEILRVSGLRAGYGGKAVVKDASFSIKRGEFCALLGENGCGKSTLLKTLAGLMPAMDGESLINGAAYCSLSDRKRARYVAFLPQHTGELPGMTVADAVLLGANAHRGFFDRPTGEEKEMCTRLLRMLDFSLPQDTLYETLSHGQRHLVTIARTLMQNAPVTLLDEPESALDYNHRRRALGAIGAWAKAGGSCVLAAMHDPNEALAFCSQIFIMQNGAIADCFTPADSSEHILRALSRIYSDVDLACFSGRYYMVAKPV